LKAKNVPLLTETYEFEAATGGGVMSAFAFPTAIIA